MPAFNEAQIIERSLTALLRQEDAGPFEVVVAANGCRDDTVALARALAPEAERRGVALSVLDIPEPGKVGALNRGDAAARYPDRIYCDADLIVSDNLVSETRRGLATDAPRFVSYRLEVARSRSALSRAYGRMWRQLPLLEREPHGIALYGVNAAGVARRGPYPQIVADDNFARLSFAPEERVRLDAVAYEFVLPEGLSELVSVRTRWSRGNEELASVRPDLLANETDGPRYDGFAPKMLAAPFDAAVFTGVYALGKLRGMRDARLGNAKWERAEASRR